MNHSDTLSLSLELLQQPSVTPIDHTCQTIMAERLAKVGFHIMYVHEQIVLLGAIPRIGYDCLGITMIA